MLVAAPMAAVGIAGAVATYVNMDNVLHRSASALGLVAAGEGATLICALVALAVTLMGQHTPATVRTGMWLVPLGASAVGILLAPTASEAVVMAFTPLAMTASGEGVAFVARRVVAHRTGVDLEQQRRSGALVWHANRLRQGGRLGQRRSRAAVMRLTKRFAETDSQMSVQLAETQRYRIGENADANLAAALGAIGGPVEHRAPQWVLDERTRKALEGPSEGRSTGSLAEWTKRAREAVDGAVEAQREPSPWFDRPAAPTEVSMPPGDLGEALRRSIQRDDAPKPQWGAASETVYDDGEGWQPVELDAEDSAPTLLTTADVIAMKGVKPGTVRTWVHRGKLTPVVVDGAKYFRAEEVANL
jgi:hypothetical protein